LTKRSRKHKRRTRPVSSGDSVSSRISIKAIHASRQVDASGSFDPRRVGGHAHGMRVGSRVYAHASAAAGGLLDEPIEHLVNDLFEVGKKAINRVSGWW